MMKIVIWILYSFAFFVHCIYCNDLILSKLHQTGYKVKDTRIELMNCSKNVFSVFEIKAFKFNRTITAHNGTFCMKVDTKDKLEVVIQGKKFLSNEYRHFPLRFQANLKRVVDTNAIGLGTLKNCGNLTTFYFYKDITYHACNFVTDETRFPPLLPDGKYRLDLTLLYLKEESALIYLYFEVYTPIAYPKVKKTG